MTDRPARPPRPQHVLHVVSTERLSPHLVRVRARGERLEAFRESPHTDAYVKITFVKPELGLEPPYDLATLRETLAPEDLPVTRTYTVRAVDGDEMTIDFVVHGDEGLAGPWAARAQPGDRLVVSGPGGGYAPDPTADWHLFVGDESAIPAIAASLEALPRMPWARPSSRCRDPGSTSRCRHPPGSLSRGCTAATPKPERRRFSSTRWRSGIRSRDAVRSSPTGSAKR